MRLIVVGGLVMALTALAGCGDDGRADAGLAGQSRPSASASAEDAALRDGVTRSPSPPARRAPSKGEQPATAPPGSPPVKVTLVRSGGFAGVQQQVVVSKTGRWTYQTRGDEDKQGRLTNAQTQRLRGWAADPKFADEAGYARSTATSCRDGYQHSLTAGDVSVTVEDCAGGFKDRPISAKIVNLLRDATPV